MDDDPISALPLADLAGACAQGSLVLNDQTAGPRAAELFDVLLRRQALALGSCSVVGGDASSLAFTGAADGLLGLGPTTLQGWLLDLAGERHCLLLLNVSAGPAPLSLPSLLAPFSLSPDLVAAALNGGEEALTEFLSFDQGLLLLSSFDPSLPYYAAAPLPKEVTNFLGTNLRAGLNFKVRGRWHADFAPLLAAVSLPVEFSWTGRVLADPFQGPVLRLDTGLQPSDFVLGPLRLRWSGAEFSFLLAALGRGYPEIRLRGGLALGPENGNFVGIEADLDIARGRLAMVFAGSVDLPTPIDLARLAGLDSLESLLPGNGGGYGGFDLESLKVVVETQPLAVTQVAFSVAARKQVELFPGLVSVAPKLDVDVLDPLGASRCASVSITGWWLLGSTAFETWISPSDKTLVAQLAPGQTVNAGVVLGKVLPGVRLPMGSVEILELELSADWGAKTFAAEIDLATDWSIPVGTASIAVTQLGAAAAFAEGKVSGCRLSGSFDLVGLRFSATAQRCDGGWKLEAATLPQEALSLTGAVNRLCSELGIAGGDLPLVPDDFKAPDVSLRDIYFSHRTNGPGGKPVSLFYCSLAHAVKITEWLTLDTVFVELEVSAAGLQGEGRVLMTIGGVDVFLSVAKRGGAWAFSGGTGPGQAIPVGVLFDYATEKFRAAGEVPDAISGLSFKDLHVDFSAAGHAEFRGTCDFTMDGVAVDLSVIVTLSKSGSKYDKSVAAQLTLGGHVFDATFWSDGQTSGLVAASARAGTVSLKDIVGAFSSSLAADVPAALSIDLKEALFAYARDQAGASTSLLCLKLGVSADLSSLPLLGPDMPKDQKLSLDEVRVLAASREVPADRVAALNLRLAVPDPARPAVAAFPEGPAAKGATVSADLSLGTARRRLTVPLSASAPAPAPSPSATPTPPPTPGAGQAGRWFDVQKSFGPLSIQRVGVDYRGGTLWLMLDAALTVSGLELGLDGLAVGSPLRPFLPRFRLAGLSLDFARGPARISGGFLSTAPDDASAAAYLGQARIETESFGLSALGAYSTVNEHPSLFVFAVLEEPLGGPPYFFVTGVAAGFGFNSRLVIPAVDGVAEFSLVKTVLKPGAPGTLAASDTPAANLDRMRANVHGALGEQWLAAGVRFTSFQMIESFALVAARLSGQFELTLLGLSRVSIPAGSLDPVAYAEIALRADFSPAAGLLAVDGVLTPASYVFSKNCHLTGGFAFYSWFDGDNAGDFVLTLGGYHPRFSKPPHFPSVPRLGMNWQVNSNVSVKGGEYFAIVPSGLMAGVSMEALWQSGDLRAWFDASADFWVQWKPFHYEADVHVQLGASYVLDLWLTSVTITVHIGADLSLWGPPFAGKAHIDLSVVSFTVSFGDSTPSRKALEWREVKDSLLPPGGRSRIRVKSGLIQEPDPSTGYAWIVNGEQLVLETACVVPSHAATFNGAAAGAGNSKLGVSPMGVTGTAFVSTHKVTLRRRDGSGRFAADVPNVGFEPVYGTLPKALWGDQGLAAAGGDGLLAGALMGLKIGAKRSRSQVFKDVELEPLLYEHNDTLPPFLLVYPETPARRDYGIYVDSEGKLTFHLSSGEQSVNTHYVLAALAGRTASDAREDLLQALAEKGLMLDTTVDLHQAAHGDVLQDWPQLAALGS